MKQALSFDFRGKTAVITGGAGVLCSGFGRALCAAGANVALLDLNEEVAKRTAGEITVSGGRAIGVKADVLNKESLLLARDAVLHEFNGIDILINGAGGNNPKATTTNEYFEYSDLTGKEGSTSFLDLDPRGIEFVFNLNCLGTMIPTQVFLRDLKEGSAILNIASMNALRPLTKIPAYSGAKAAVANFTQWLSVYLSKVGIRVNAIAPGFFATEQNHTLLFNADGTHTPRSKKIIDMTPMGRYGEVEDLFGALLFLCDSNMSGFVTGIVLCVDGGFGAYSGI